MQSSGSKDTILEVESGTVDMMDGQSGEFSDIDYRSEDGPYVETSEQCFAKQEHFTSTSASSSHLSTGAVETPLRRYKETGRLPRESLAELYKPLFTEGEEKSKAVQFIQDEFDLQMPSGTESDIAISILAEVGRVLCRLIGKRFLLLYNTVLKDEGEDDVVRNSTDEQEPLSPATSHLIIWAILLDKQGTLLELVRQSQYPLGFGLLSARIYHQLFQLSKRDDRELSRAWKDKSSEMEMFVCDITNRLSFYGKESTISSVGERMNMFELCDSDGKSYPGLLFSPTDVALEGKLKTFLSTSAVQAYSRKLFYNEIDTQRRHWLFFPVFWLPPLPILLARPWGLLKYRHGRYLERISNKDNDSVPDCLFFNLIQTISPLPNPSLHGVWRYKPSFIRKYLVNSSLYQYYTAPVNVYQYYLISHLCLLLLFTHMMISDMGLEWLVAAWFAAFFISDVHQMLTSSSTNPLVGVSRKGISVILKSALWNLPEKTSILLDSRSLHILQKWLSDEWHFLDLGLYFLFFLGLICHHLSSAGSGVTRALYASAILLAFAKLMRFCVLWKTVASNIIRIFLIARKLVPLFFILLLAAVGFGVAYISVLRPIPEDKQSTRRNTYMIFFTPFWHIFGAVQLEDMHYEMKAAARNACFEEDFNMWDPSKWTGCYTGWMAPIFTALFVFLANLVLFTYIIGVVSHYYGKTKKQTEEIWAAEVIKLMEWSAQLSLPPPPVNLIWFFFRFFLTLFLLIYLGVLWILRKRKRYEEPEELMVNYPGCFSTYLHIVWILTWFYKTPRTKYTRSSTQSHHLVAKVLEDIGSRGSHPACARS